MTPCLQITVMGAALVIQLACTFAIFRALLRGKPSFAWFLAMAGWAVVVQVI